MLPLFISLNSCMYRDDDKKIVILFPPKSGSSSIRRIIKSSNSSNNLINDQIHIYHHRGLVDLENKKYQFHCFYRNPYDRLISCIFHIKNKMFPILDDCLKLSGNRNISFKEMINSYDSIFEYSALKIIVAPQTNWIKQSTVLYSFHDFNLEVSRLMYNIGVRDFELYHENINIKNIEEIDDYCVEKLKEICNAYYREDYDLFESRGIRFDK